MGMPAVQIKPIAGHKIEEKSVRDIMKPLENFSSISADTTVKNAVYILKNSATIQSFNSGQNYLLIFENKSLIGFVGIPELFASIQPPNIRDDWYRGWNVANWVEPVFMKGLFTSLCLDVADKPVRDIMVPATTALITDSTLEEAAFKFFREKKDMCPVTENGKLVGILTAYDLFSEMANIFS